MTPFYFEVDRVWGDFCVPTVQIVDLLVWEYLCCCVPAVQIVDLLVWEYLCCCVPTVQIVDLLVCEHLCCCVPTVQIVDLLVRLLMVIEDTPAATPECSTLIHHISVDAYDVLETYLQGDSRKNELYFAKYIDFFGTQFEAGVSNIDICTL